jgi:hypothetical protein
MATTIQKQLEKLNKTWDKAHAAWEKACQNYQEDFAKYHWTAADDGWKWKHARIMAKRTTVAWEKAEAAREAFEAAMRRALKK